MNVPLLDLHPQLQRIRPQLLEALTRVLDSTQYINGEEVKNFESVIAQYCNSAHGIGLSSGTDALLAALMALGIGPGDQVLTTPYSFFATMGVVLRVGATPVFTDIDPESFNMNAWEAAEILAADRKKGRKIKAILPVHLYGQCADMPRLLALSQEYETPLIEDAAQAIGAECPFVQADGAVEWRRAGSMGLCGCFSFFPSKNLGGMGDGGMLATSDKNFADIVRSVRNHGQEENRYFHSRVGGNFRLDAVQAAVLSVKLKYLDTWHAGRRKNAALYRRLFADADLDSIVKLPKEIYAGLADSAAHHAHIYNQFVIRAPKRDELAQYLKKHEIGHAVYYPLCLHEQQCLPESARVKGRLPVAEEAAASSLALPVFPDLMPEQLSFVVDTIKAFYKNNA